MKIVIEILKGIMHMNIKTFNRFAVAMLAGLFITIHPSFAQMKININDLLVNPEKFYWQEIIIEGKVVELRQVGDSQGKERKSSSIFEGHYTLEDKFGKKITIESENLPPIGSKFKVTASVKPGEKKNSYGGPCSRISSGHNQVEGAGGQRGIRQHQVYLFQQVKLGQIQDRGKHSLEFCSS
jgi:hypothetical protein